MDMQELYEEVCKVQQEINKLIRQVESIQNRMKAMAMYPK